MTTRTASASPTFFCPASFGRTRVAGLVVLALAACSSGGTSTAPPAHVVLLSSATGGAGMLGELTKLPLEVSGPASTFHAFAGRPWIDDPHHDGHGLVWNAADNRFYGVLSGGGAYGTGVLLAFDPATDGLALLKTLSGREYQAKAGLGGAMLPFRKADGFYRKPLLTPDGKGLLLLSSNGGVDFRGLLVHVNIDPASASYLTETIVYDFFDYEVGQGTSCNSLRAAGVDGQSELAWGTSGGRDVVFMARVGTDYVLDPGTNNPTEPGTCSTYTLGSETHDRIRGRMFALQPTDPADLSRPWEYALGYGPAAGSLDPLLHLGRQLYWDARHLAVRWATEVAGGGSIDFYAGGTSTLFSASGEQCYRLNGLLPLDANGNSIATCSGLSTTTLEPGVVPRIFKFTSNDLLDQSAALGGWLADRRFFRGSTSSLLSRRLFANGGYAVDDCFTDQLGCGSPSTIEELDPALGYPEQVLVTGSRATTGQFYFGDPGVGGSIREPIADRYLAWFGAEVNGYSNTLNKYDRLTDRIVTIPLDPVAGAYPKGRLLDLGNGTALGFMGATPPPGGAAVGTRPGGYLGNGIHERSRPGSYLLDLKSGVVLSMFPNPAELTAASQEQVRLDDGSVWVAYSESVWPGPTSWRNLARLDTATGARTVHAYLNEEWNYDPADAYALAGRKSAALYLPFWQSSVTPFSSHAVNATLGCVRADNGAVVAQSDPFGPAQAATGNAHRIVYGATWSPTNNAMYLATSRVADLDQGTIFEIDKGVTDAALCTAKPVVTAIVTGLTDVPSTRPLSTRSGALLYGTANGKLMRLDPAGRVVTPVADLKGAAAASSQVRGYLAEAADGVVVAVVYDYDAAGKNTARRLVSVVVGTGAATSRDVTALIDEFEPYPGVMQLN